MQRKNSKFNAPFQKDLLINMLVLMVQTGATKEELQAALDEIHTITVDEILREAEASLAKDKQKTESPLTLAESIRRKIAESQSAKKC
jgi:predicted Zn-dependent peptidase